MGIKSSWFLDAATQKESKRGGEARWDASPSHSGLPSGSHKCSTKAEPASRPLRGATRTGRKQARRVHLRYRTKLLFILPLITLMEVPL